MSESMTHVKREIMDRILEIRYTDLEEERRLCQQLLQWANEHEDFYATAFAHVYLGDYFVALNDGDQSGFHLLQAKNMLYREEAYPELSMRLYTLLGIYYKFQADEQNSIQCYLDAIVLSRKLNDIQSECVILNNIAYSLQCHQSYREALRYYMMAYQLQKPFEESAVRSILLGNLTELHLLLGEPEEARRYIEECGQLKGEIEGIELQIARNWCCYYAAVGDEKKALAWADEVLEQSKESSLNQLSFLENYSTLCEAMMNIGNKEYTLLFVELLERVSKNGGVDQLQVLHDRRMEYKLMFELEESHGQAYKEYYEQSIEFKKRINESISNAMKTKIRLDQLLTKKEELQFEKMDLETQVNKDDLTGIYNRRFLEKLLLERAKKPVGICLGIVMVDVDYFKEYNDHYGHLEGDKVLQKIAACLKENSVEGIYPCRYGGDEFTCVCDGLEERQIEDFVKAVRGCLEEHPMPHLHSRCGDRVTLSIGFSIAGKEKEADSTLLLHLADQALYLSKLHGRNSYTCKRIGET